MAEENWEQEIFDLMDDIEHDEAEKLVESAETDGIAKVSDKVLEGIKSRAYKKIGIKMHGRKKLLSGIKPAAVLAGSIALLLIILNFNTVMAQVKRILYYVPGINSVLTDNKGTGKVYTLEKPVEVKVGSGSIIVKGVSVENGSALVVMWGKDAPALSTITLRDAKGQEYTACSHLTSGGQEWLGTYWYNGNIKDAERIEVVLNDQEGTVIPLELQPADSFDSYEQMGPTDTKNGVSITVVPSIDGGKLKINLITPPKEGSIVQSYAEYGEAAELVDDTGRKYERSKPDMSFLPRDEFSFDIGEEQVNSDATYKLTVPYMVTERFDSGARGWVDIKVPGSGSQRLDVKTELAGFPVAFTSIERLKDDAVRLYVDTGYREDDAASLRSFSVGNMSKAPFFTKYAFMRDGTVTDSRAILSHMMKVNEVTNAVEYFEFNIDPKADRITLFLQNPEIVTRGPWVFKIQPEG